MKVGPNIPKSLIALCEKDGRVIEVVNELWSDGDHRNNYWLTLADGWNWCDCGSIHENTIENCRAELGRVKAVRA